MKYNEKHLKILRKELEEKHGEEFVKKHKERLDNEWEYLLESGLISPLLRKRFPKENLGLPKDLKDELKAFKDKGINPVVARYGEVDIAFPANEKEYCDLGGYSFMEITAITEDNGELPIERAYFKLGEGKIMPLKSLELAVDNEPHFTNRVVKTEDDDGMVYYKSVSFWAISTGFFIDNKGLIAIDFKGGRKHFVIRRGPWGLAKHIYEWVEKRTSNQIKVNPGPIGYDLIAHFIQREFMK